MHGRSVFPLFHFKAKTTECKVFVGPPCIYTHIYNYKQEITNYSDNTKMGLLDV